MIRFGIVGFGLHAVKRMMPGFAFSHNCRVTALSRRDLEKAQASAREYDINYAFASTAELCRCPEVDAVFVTTPNSLHLSDTLTALACGKPVLCEKPMGMNAGECRRMVEAARKAKLLLGVAHVFRFEESVSHLRARIAAGQIGRPVLARSEFSFKAGKEHARTWIYDHKLAGGGPISDVGVHCIDTLRYLLDDRVVRVSARGVANQEFRDIEDVADLTLEFSRGTIGAVLVSYLVDYRTPLEIVGELGALHADDCLTVERPVTMELRRGGATVESETVDNHLAYARQLDAFADALEGGTNFPVPGEEGWQNQEILDAAYRSLLSGRAEAVPSVG